MNSSRFTLVVYDEVGGEQQWRLRQKFLTLESAVKEGSASHRDFQMVQDHYNKHFAGSRGEAHGTSALWHSHEELSKGNPEACLDALEISYMWFGKAIREKQLQRTSAELPSA